MDLNVKLRNGINLKGILLLALLLVSVGGLYVQNVVNFDSLYSSQVVSQDEYSGAPIQSTGASQPEIYSTTEDSITKRASAPVSVESNAAPKMTSTPLQTQLVSETYREKTLLQEPIYYYIAIAILSLMLLMNIFRVSFQSQAVFDSDIFKTLSSDTRVEMLYALQERRKTLSELAYEVKISLPGAKQHLEMLMTKGLVEKMDEGRKWKYYSLTSKGKSIIAERLA